MTYFVFKQNLKYSLNQLICHYTSYQLRRLNGLHKLFTYSLKLIFVFLFMTQITLSIHISLIYKQRLIFKK